MMQWLKQHPMIHLLLAFCMGVLSYTFLFKVNSIWVFSSIILLVVALSIFHFVPSYTKFIKSHTIGALSWLLVLCMGILTSWFWADTNSPLYFEKHIQKNSILDAVIQNTPIEKDKTYKLDVKIVGLYHGEKYVHTIGNTILYIQKSDAIAHSIIGQHILLKNKITPIQQAKNPGAFDYKYYCSNNNIYTTAYLQNTDWRPTQHIAHNFTLYCNRLNQSIRNTLHLYIKDTNATGIAEALLIGYRYNMDADLWQAYANAGIAHIIAISGMHMAMIYGGILFILSYMPFFKHRKKINTYIAIAAMWLFAFVIGMPASVIRAAVMLSTIGMARILNKETLPINVLASSALLLLCIQPTWLFDVGFQLSFLAVLSLILFNKPIEKQFYFSRKWMQKIWALISSTLAAQVLTLPICIYYFHQFPILFLISNLVAIPLSAIILYAEIVLIVVQKIPILASILGMFISKSIYVLNAFILGLNKLSFINWKNISISYIQMILLFIIIVCIAMYTKWKKKNSVWLALTALVLLLASNIYTQYQVLHQAKLVVYQTNKQSAIDILVKNKAQLFGDNIDTKTNKYVIQPAHMYYHINANTCPEIQTYNTEKIQAISYSQKKIIHLKTDKLTIPNTIEIDYLILSNGAINNIESITTQIKPKQIILDASIPMWKIDAIKNKLSELHLPIFSVTESGAYIANL